MFGPLENPDIIRKNKTWLILDTSRRPGHGYRSQNVCDRRPGHRLRRSGQRDLRGHSVYGAVNLAGTAIQKPEKPVIRA